MAKKCKKLEEIKKMFEEIEIDVNKINTNEFQKFYDYF